MAPLINQPGLNQSRNPEGEYKGGAPKSHNATLLFLLHGLPNQESFIGWVQLIVCPRFENTRHDGTLGAGKGKTGIKISN